MSFARAAIPLVALLVPACANEHTVVDLAMTSAYRPHAGPALGHARGHGAPADFWMVLAGDLHCHVRPPDDPGHVVRGVQETIGLARAERLDFVVFTPHVPARFFQDPAARQWVMADQRALRAEIALGAGPSDPLLIPGFEYTDHQYGHVGAAFADLDAVLRDVPEAAALEHPGRFFTSWVAHGGTLVVNHPLVTPLDSSIAMARADISWRPFTGGDPVPEEIAVVDALATGFEAYNLTATHLRDRYLQWDTDRTLALTYARLDREVLLRGRPMTALGGSDSHSQHLRATTFVLTKERSIPAVRDALRSGRVCVRDPAACSLRVRAAGREAPWLVAGERLQDATEVEVTTLADDTTIYVSGVAVARARAGDVTRLAVPKDACSAVRITAGKGYSGTVYVNCTWP